MAEENKTNREDLTFEEAMKGLEQIVSKLEEGDVPLEKAIDYFQEGMALSKKCHEKLQNVEKQMDYILRENGELAPFSVREEEKGDR
ncbi:exodeoxyribonuclease VII small subunit [Bacillus paralicheniformis]|uniref:exodeoxyribonuclease VII small subunit n=1 Tax=Bacillus paralicheniformis TaxID=1648923 RepID=UPI0011A1F4B8|nr:exodeoxyribonuclease VII small subunit [Bacillus paralicheniformis]TWK45777.1 Exodeoxyribonuclease 7 small subunit [Bacillus paralicheniformis]